MTASTNATIKPASSITLKVLRKIPQLSIKYTCVVVSISRSPNALSKFRLWPNGTNTSLTNSIRDLSLVNARSFTAYHSEGLDQ